MEVAVVTVGDELLSGETENTNATWLCRRLTERQASVRRVVTVPDEEADIARVVNELHADYDATVVTGGLGPTHDDRTMAGVAAAFGRELTHSDVAEEWLVEHGGYSASDLAEGTAEVPAGARVLHNEPGVAPGAVVESTYVLPGVPEEMRAMFESVADEFTGEETFVETVFAAEPESALVERFRRVQEGFDVDVGSYPGDGVRIRVSGTDADEVDDGAAWLRERVDSGEEGDSGREVESGEDGER